MRRGNVSNKLNNDAGLAGSLRILNFFCFVSQGKKDLHCSVTFMPISFYQLQPSQPTSLGSTLYLYVYKTIYLS